jgi:isocitrate dehydrogenase
MISSPRRSRRPRQEGVLFSLHMKATMMKVSDPIIFGHAVKAVARAGVRDSMATELDALGVNPNRASATLLERCKDSPRSWPRSTP